MLSRFNCKFRVHALTNVNKLATNWQSNQTIYLNSTVWIQSRSVMCSHKSVGKELNNSGQRTSYFQHRNSSNEMDCISKEPTIEKEMANALSSKNNEVLVNLIESTLASSNAIIISKISII